MNKNSNTYIISYAIIMVVVVASVLSIAALSLQPLQEANVIIEKKTDILVSVGQGAGADDAVDKTKYINDQYKEFITDSYAVNVKGEKVPGADAFALLTNLKSEYDKPVAERSLPIFVSKSETGEMLYVLPLWGKGLWGPVWGYISLKEDWTTVSGVVFGHKSETPGLGAEIATPVFEDAFKNKRVHWDGSEVKFSILKGAGSSKGNDSAVDAITGGTITCRGVESMLQVCLDGYEKFILEQRAENKNINN